MLLCFLFFFFQAEDGIRDYKVTGVQTCALPISRPEAGLPAAVQLGHDREPGDREGPGRAAGGRGGRALPEVHRRVAARSAGVSTAPVRVGVIGTEIGRASCRERV